MSSASHRGGRSASEPRTTLVSRLAGRVAWLCFGALATLASPAARADKVSNSASQLSVLLGSISGSYTGPIVGEISISTGIEIGYEMFTTPKSSWFLHATVGEDAATARMAYLAFGVGKRYYFSSIGMLMDAEDGQTRITQQSKWRYYYGYQGGLAEVAFVRYEVYEISSTMLEVGGHLGAIWQVGKSVGINGQFNFDYGYGFTSTSVTGTAKKILFGISFYL